MQIDFSSICERFVDTYGDLEALVNLERGRRYTHREYHQLTNRILNMIEDTMGLEKGDRYMPILKNDNLSLMTWYISPISLTMIRGSLHTLALMMGKKQIPRQSMIIL